MSQSLQGKTAIITGSTRGIGREIALKLAQAGANIVITGKTTITHPKLEGTLYTVEQELLALGASVLAIPLDVRDEDAIDAMVAKATAKFSGIDILINNASAIALTDTLHTSLKKFDLMFAVNVRATFACARACIPYLKQSRNAHILTLSPPLNMQDRWFKAHLAYTMSKYGMSMCTLGLAAELKPFAIAVNSLWPQTFIATAAIKNNFPPEVYRGCRSPAIVALAALHILQEPAAQSTGQFFIDEDYLRSKGFTDFAQYAIDPAASLKKDLYLD